MLVADNAWPPAVCDVAFRVVAAMVLGQWRWIVSIDAIINGALATSLALVAAITSAIEPLLLTAGVARRRIRISDLLAGGGFGRATSWQPGHRSRRSVVKGFGETAMQLLRECCVAQPACCRLQHGLE